MSFDPSAWQRDVFMNNASNLLLLYIYPVIIIMLNKMKGLTVGLWQHQEGLSGYAWEHHLKDKHRHSHHSLRVFLGQEYPYKGYFRSRIHPLRVFLGKGYSH